MLVKDLEGLLLDYWVARADGADLGPDWNQGDWVIVGGHSGHPQIEYSPSSIWEQGGPTIEREHIELLHYGKDGENLAGNPWEAQIGVDTHYIDQGPGDAMGGPTPLIAAMRAYVASKFGEEVEDAQLESAG